MRCLPLIALLSACIPALPTVDDPCGRWAEPGLYAFNVDVDGKKRKSYVWMPDSKGPRVLVFVLHGARQSRQEIAASTEFIPLANKKGFAAVFPTGMGLFGKSWDRLDEKKHDDVAFLDTLVAELSPEVCGAGVLATGFSQGGMMAHRWACESDVVDAIVPAAGAVTVDGCKKGRPVPVRHYHGDADPIVGFDGTDNLRAEYQSVAETLKVWRTRNNCVGESEVFLVDGDISCESWQCDVPTELCTVAGWGHLWPGGTHRAGDEHDATIEAWDWFQSMDSNLNAPPTTSSDASG